MYSSMCEIELIDNSYGIMVIILLEGIYISIYIYIYIYMYILIFIYIYR